MEREIGARDVAGAYYCIQVMCHCEGDPQKMQHQETKQTRPLFLLQLPDFSLLTHSSCAQKVTSRREI